uniref:Uncharacterized protein n=1 Tax=Leptocylindrus danicus TaxID=163516 RepID=A0A7S2KDS9_9STRA|mmetsp:Transcript_20883/g.31144  ORF Transcript_20883/g.31144 Transcript_20883/m.31144 type:complete len:287 (+) Transcript_20883:116-976(+)
MKVMNTISTIEMPHTVTMNAEDQTVIIFDWDDTICPSSFVDQCKIDTYRDLPLHYQNLFKEISRCAEKCLEAASKFGEVLIITNSDDGWVRYSAEKYIPHILPILDKYRIVSARTRYESYYPNQPLCWKAAAFAHEVNEVYSYCAKAASANVSMDSIDVDDKVSTVSDGSFDTALTSMSEDSLMGGEGQQQRQVISFGDSMEERTSVKIVATQLNATAKSVMFLQSPSPAQIIGELVMLTSSMTYLCTQKQDLDLEIGRGQAEKTCERYLNARNGSAVRIQQGKKA